MAIQAIYGADTTTRTGNTVYGFHSTAGKTVYDFAVNKHPVLCIYDANGVDTLDLSQWSTASRIDLAPGSFSDADAMTKNISIAKTTWIENAVGGGGNDQVCGNTLANVLCGKDGNDQVNGREGSDQLFGDAGADTLCGGGGNDRLEGGTDNDTLRGEAGNDVVVGGAGRRALWRWRSRHLSLLRLERQRTRKRRRRDLRFLSARAGQDQPRGHRCQRGACRRSSL